MQGQLGGQPNRRDVHTCLADPRTHDPFGGPPVGPAWEPPVMSWMCRNAIRSIARAMRDMFYVPKRGRERVRQSAPPNREPPP